MSTKYVFITGGVVSGLGKGIAGASLAALLEARGFKVTLQKLDPYLNVDPGTMSPFQHGEVFVTDDGAETDLDLGHYERFTSAVTGKANSITAGRIYQTVIEKERRGDYLGKTVQVIPHVTDEIKDCIRRVSADNDVVIVEIGGTVGDIESLPFLEAIRQFRKDVGRGNALNIHVTLVPYIAASDELKTKPTQHSVKELLSIGIKPDVLLCRSDRPIPEEMKKKIALFCNVDEPAVITAQDVSTIYECPLAFAREGLDQIVLDYLSLPHSERDLTQVGPDRQPLEEPRRRGDDRHRRQVRGARRLVQVAERGAPPRRHREQRQGAPRVRRLGGPRDDRLPRGALPGRRHPRPGRLRPPRHRGDAPRHPLRPGDEGPLLRHLPRHAVRRHRVRAKRLRALANANSTEFDANAPHKVIYKLRDLIGIEALGGTMRLGKYPCELADGSTARRAYGEPLIHERHRHRYEVNQEYLPVLREAGLAVTGVSPDRKFVEMVELPDHPWFLGCQFHPEFKSKPTAAHPLFRDFVRAARAHQAARKEGVAQKTASLEPPIPVPANLPPPNGQTA